MLTKQQIIEIERRHRALQRRVLVQHFDANETAFLERELTQLRARIMEVQYPELKARAFVPKASDIASSAETYAFKVYEPVGRAKIGAYKGNDAPRVDVVAKEVTGKVRPVTASFGFDIGELREAARTNTPLPEMKARFCRNAIELGVDDVLAFGTTEGGAGPSVNLTGLVNNAAVVSNGLGALSDWAAGATPVATIMNELNGMASALSSSTKMVFAANTILLPVKHFLYIEQTPYSAQLGDSILTVFLKNNKRITSVEPWYQLDTAGAASKPRGITYQKDPMVLEGVIPQEYEQLPPEAKGFELITNAHARCGGVKVYQPLGMKYYDFAN